MRSIETSSLPDKRNLTRCLPAGGGYQGGHEGITTVVPLHPPSADTANHDEKLLCNTTCPHLLSKHRFMKSHCSTPSRNVCRRVISGIAILEPAMKCQRQSRELIEVSSKHHRAPAVCLGPAMRSNGTALRSSPEGNSPVPIPLSPRIGSCDLDKLG